MKIAKLLGAVVLVLGSFALVTNDAKAQGFFIGVGHSRYYGGWNNGYPGGPRHHVYHRGHQGGRHYWHDTSHYDYHPGGFVRHYNHYDYVPGHYDYHQTGHWHHGH